MNRSTRAHEGLKQQLLDILKQSAGGLVIASAILAPPAVKAAVNPEPEKAVSARVEKIHGQIGQHQPNLEGKPDKKGNWHNWFNLPIWSNWSDWTNVKPWYNWGDWANKWHNWNDWGNQKWNNWGDWGNHHKGKHH